MPEILKWLEANVSLNMPKDARVLEIGSRNFNGTARDVLRQYASSWVGVDMDPGQDVDVVASGRDYLLANPNEQFDAIICMESYEHDPRWWETNELALKALTPGGIYVVSTPTIGFPIHNYPGDFYRFTPMAHRDVVMDGMCVFHQETVGPGENNLSLCTAGRKLLRTPGVIPVTAYTICDDAYMPWLPGWVHWHKNRFDGLLVLMNKPAPLVEAFCREHRISVLRTTGHRKFVTDDYVDIYRNAALRGLSAWYAVIDVDEVFDVQQDPRALAAEIAATGNIYAWFEVVNRVPLSGQILPLPEPDDMFTVFDADSRFHSEVRGGNPWKPALRRCDMHGLHKLEHKPGRRWHDPRQFRLHHFDLCLEGIQTTEMKRDQQRALGWTWLNEYGVALQALNEGAVLTRQVSP